MWNIKRESKKKENQEELAPEEDERSNGKLPEDKIGL